MESKRPVDKNTGFLIGSLTKAFTAACVGIFLKERGKTWNTKIRDLLPFKYNADPIVLERATVVDFLAHRTGIDNFSTAWYGPYAYIMRTRWHLIQMLEHFPVASSFRSGFNYCNHTYGMLGCAIGMESGPTTTWSHLQETRILKPLGMKNTSAIMRQFGGDSFAEPHMPDSSRRPVEVKRPVNMTGKFDLGPAGGMCSTVPDMLIWGNEVLRCLKEDADGPATKPSPLQEVPTLVAHHAVVGTSGIAENSYGLGWGRVSLPSSGLGSLSINGPSTGRVIGSSSKPRLVLHHGGLCGGYLASICIVPDDELVVIAFSNGYGFGDITDWAMQAVLQEALDLSQKIDFLEAAKKHADEAMKCYDKLKIGYDKFRTDYDASRGKTPCTFEK